MKTFTKSQVLALFLGFISAVELNAENSETNDQASEPNTETTETNEEVSETNADTVEPTPENNLLTPITLLNGPGMADQVPEGQSLTPVSSGTLCNGNADCSADNGEKCGNFQVADSEPTNLCVAQNLCGALGKINSNIWSIQCWKDTAEGEVPATPAVVDAHGHLIGLGDLITKNDPWHAAENLFVSPRYNYQDGWWILNGENKWVETDKPIDNRCFVDLQCPAVDGAESCCGTYPDTNNRRCMPKSLHSLQITVGPVTFTPFCSSMSINQNPEEPISIGDDIAKGALAEAAEALEDFYENQLADAKDLQDYENMDEEAQADFNAKQQEIEENRNALFTELKTIVGYEHEDCDDECKARFEDELLQWEKQKYEVCKYHSVGIACREADQFKREEETARAGGEDALNYYKEMNDEDRFYFKEERESSIKALEATLTAAWVEENQPAMGEAGSSCAYTKCTNINHCCGTSTPKIGKFVNDKLENVCVDKTSLLYEDSLGREFNHVCAATKAFVSAVAAATALYSLM